MNHTLALHNTFKQAVKHEWKYFNEYIYKFVITIISLAYEDVHQHVRVLWTHQIAFRFPSTKA